MGIQPEEVLKKFRKEETGDETKDERFLAFSVTIPASTGVYL